MALARHNPLDIQELVESVVSFVQDPADLINCACINKIWRVIAMKKLYRGSINEMRYRTPALIHLHGLFVACPERFSEYMGFVHHLILMPERPALEKLQPPERRIACFERCGALRHRHNANLLLQPRGNGPSTLAIPFEMMTQSLSHIFDLVLNPRLRFLTIDHSYCELLASHHDKLRNLAALSIHRSYQAAEIQDLCTVLRSCNLELFNLQESPRQLPAYGAPDIVELFDSLKRHTNLRVLAFMPRGYWEDGEREFVAALNEDRRIWPNLGALYLAIAHTSRLEVCLKMRNLQVLYIGRYLTRTHRNDTARGGLAEIAKLQSLRTLTVRCLGNIDDPDLLLLFARSCPLLQRLHAGVAEWPTQSTELMGHQFSLLSHCLPRLELLSMDVLIRIRSSELRDLAQNCPHLMALELPRAYIILSQASLKELFPFRRLEFMHAAGIIFAKPRHLLEPSRLEGLADEWKRVFPRLRQAACACDTSTLEYEGSIHDPTATVLSPRIEEFESCDEGALWAATDDLAFISSAAPWFRLRHKLYDLLDLRGCSYALRRFYHTWQTNFEMQNFGWPVIPFDMYLKPDVYGEHQGCRKSYFLPGLNPFE